MKESSSREGVRAWMLGRDELKRRWIGHDNNNNICNKLDRGEGVMAPIFSSFFYCHFISTIILFLYFFFIFLKISFVQCRTINSLITAGGISDEVYWPFCFEFYLSKNISGLNESYHRLNHVTWSQTDHSFLRLYRYLYFISFKHYDTTCESFVTNVEPRCPLKHATCMWLQLGSLASWQSSGH